MLHHCKDDTFIRSGLKKMYVGSLSLEINSCSTMMIAYYERNHVKIHVGNARTAGIVIKDSIDFFIARPQNFVFHNVVVTRQFV